MPDVINIVQENRKSENALRTIGETAEIIGVSIHILWFWENKFPQLNPSKRRGYRYYKSSEIELLFRIKDLIYKEGYSIAGSVQLSVSNISLTT